MSAAHTWLTRSITRPRSRVSGGQIEASISRRTSHRDAVALKAELDSLQKITDSHGRFDRVFSINVLQFLKNRQDALRSLFNATAAGGVLATTYQPRGTNPTREDALRMAEEIRTQQMLALSTSRSRNCP
jgi:hypothetical protein